MADANHDNRPLSPHLTIYRPQITSVLSILNRITGIAMAFPVILIVFWFLAAAIGAPYFEFVDGLLTSWLGLLILVASLWAFWFHLFNGLRHLAWDMILGLEMTEVHKTGWLVFGLSIFATLVSVGVAVFAGS
jgi:succinate dehydrogenase / fumarate reductase cytochrome b subunit